MEVVSFVEILSLLAKIIRMSRAYTYGAFRYGGYSLPKEPSLPQKYP